MKARIAGFLPETAFSRGVSVLVGGTAGAQAIVAIATPVLTRLYSPEAFGTFAVYAALVTLIGSLSTLYYFLAIPLPEDDAEASSIVFLCGAILVCFVLAMTPVSLIYASPISEALGVPGLAGYLWLIPVGVFFTGVYAVLSHWAIRSKEYSNLAVASLGQAFAAVAIQVAGYKAGVGALIGGQAVGQGVGQLSLVFKAARDRALRTVSRRGIVDAAIRHRQFPLYLSWAGLFNIAGTQLPPLMFAALFGASAAGLYLLAYKILVMPIQLVGNAVGNAFLSDAPAEHRSGSLGPLVDVVHYNLAHIAMPPILLVFALGPELFATVFGHEWRAAGEYARWIAPWIYFSFCDSGLRVFIVTGHQRLSLVMHSVQLLVRIVAIALGALSGDILFTIALFSLGSAVTTAIFIFVKLRVSLADTGSAITSHLGAMLYGIVCVSPVLVMSVVDDSPIHLAVGLAGFIVLTTARYMHLYRREH